MILNIIGRILSAFLFLNSQETKIVHSDIKDKNVIIWIENKQRGILDFGLAHDIDSSDAYMTSLVKTNKWMAPEILRFHIQNFLDQNHNKIHF